MFENFDKDCCENLPTSSEISYIAIVEQLFSPQISSRLVGEDEDFEIDKEPDARSTVAEF